VKDENREKLLPASYFIICTILQGYVTALVGSRAELGELGGLRAINGR